MSTGLLRGLTSALNDAKQSIAQPITVEEGSFGDLIRRFWNGDIDSWSKLWDATKSAAGFAVRGGPDDAATRAEGIAKLKEAFAARSAAGAAGGKTSPASTQKVEQYIREAAVARGIDPNVAVAVAKSEGLDRYVGDMGSSFGPFQLHYGGLAPGMMQTGLGDTFTRQTGLNARDPSTWRQQIDFALDQAKAGGWGPWHGWRGAQWAGIDAGGSRSPGGGAGTSIGNINVNVHANNVDANSLARDVDSAIRRSVTAGSANYGPQ